MIPQGVLRGTVDVISKAVGRMTLLEKMHSDSRVCVLTFWVRIISGLFRYPDSDDGSLEVP